MSLHQLRAVLADARPRVIACSGGVDSLTLATVAARQLPDDTIVAHAVTPAVPAAASARVHAAARHEGWLLELVQSSEFDDEQYLSNPVDRCYHCKSHLYRALDLLVETRLGGGAVLMSGANLDDLGEYRPGLQAAAERDVRHPFVEASIDKREVREIARHLGLDVAEVPASPCLASRLYTGTRVSAARLRAVDLGEELVKLETGIEVVRCRIRLDQVLVELHDDDRGRIDDTLLRSTLELMRSAEPGLASIALDAQPYRPGRSFVVST